MAKLDKKKIDLIKTLMNYNEEDIHEKLLPSVLNKMNSFLVGKGCAKTKEEITRMFRIDIKGMDENGGERRMGKELREKLGLDILMASKKFSTFYPIINEGVIRYSSINAVHYTHFKVISQTEKTFELELNEYKDCHNAFYLSFSINVGNLSKYEPFYMSDIVGKDVRTLLFDKRELGKEANAYFTDLEKSLVRTTIQMEQEDVNEEFSVILYNAISNIRVINYLWEYYIECKNISGDGDNFYNNQYFRVKNWQERKDELIDLDLLYKRKIRRYIADLLEESYEPKILERGTISQVITEIAKSKNITQLHMAVGFAFQSGLKKIEEAIQVVRREQGQCEMILGSLQNYDEDINQRKIDKSTVKYLNELICKKRILLYTYKEAFYHGKFYYLASEKNAYIIVGSSNISKTAFDYNYEMDVLFVVEKGSEQDKKFCGWYEQLKKQCKEINRINEKIFQEYNWQSELDVFQSANLKKISPEEIRKRIQLLSDEETKFRQNLWLAHNPVVYDDVGIDALKAYTMYVFEEKELVVFESFIPQNAFYAFACPNGIEDLIITIKSMTKTQMTFSQNYINRGNHTLNREKLKQRIDKFFD